MSCNKKITLGHCLDLMYKNARTHLWIVDKKEKVESVVSLRDIINTIALKAQEKDSPRKSDKKRSSKKKDYQEY